MFSLLRFFGMPGPMELLIIAMIALLLFGNRLPSVMRSMGRGIVEFKKGVQGIEDDVDDAVHAQRKLRARRRKAKSRPRADPPATRLDPARAARDDSSIATVTSSPGAIAESGFPALQFG